MPEVGLYNVEVLINLTYSLIAMITCSVYKQMDAEIASVLKTLNIMDSNTCTRISGFTVSRYLS